jgi:hypothetical protein
MDVLTRIREVIAAEPNDAQLDRFLTEVRDSLMVSSRQFLAYSALVVTSLVTYHLVVYQGTSVVSFNAVQVSDLSLFRRVFLVLPAALLAIMAAVGYLRRLQREVYDYLTISRYKVLGKTGLHELRLPADYILGLFVLRNEGGPIGKAVSNVVTYLLIAAFVFGPVVYIVNEAVANIHKFGAADLLCVIASAISIVLCLCSLVIASIAGRINAR